MQQMMQRAVGRRQGFWQRLMGRGYAPWVVEFGPFVLKVASLAFSLYSANAIRWVFSGLGVADRIEMVMVWVIAGAFGVTGYFITRGLAFRMMNRDRVRGYILICFLVELVEISCNLLEALVAMQHATQFDGFGPGVHSVLTVVVCVMWSSVPLISIGLAILDMDMEREKRGLIARSKAASPGFGVSGLGGSSMASASRMGGGGGPAPMPVYPGASQVPGPSGTSGNRPLAGAGRP